MKIQFPIIGIQYWRAPTPTEPEWEKDLELTADIGFEVIQLRVQWSWHERLEGKYDFDDLLRLMDVAHKKGLKVAVKFQLVCAPYWLFENYAADRIMPNGAVIPPINLGAEYAGLYMPCFDRPLVREKASGFMKKLVELTSRHPALFYYSLWNEIRSIPYGDCACPDSRRKFENYLRGNFETVAEMNRRLGKDYGDFSHFRPPAGLTEYTSPMIWRLSRAWGLADTLNWVKGIVREIAPNVPVVTHTGCNNMINAAADDSTNDFSNASVVDWYGHSGVFWDGIFHSYDNIEGRCTRGNSNWRNHGYILSMQDAWTRSVSDGKPAFNYELYANDYGAFNPDFQAQEMYDFYCTSLSEGIHGFVMWGVKAERFGDESHGVGLVDLDGKITSRALAVKDIIKFIKIHRELLASYEPEPGQVAIVYDLKSDILSSIQDQSIEPKASKEIYRYKNNLKGWYRLFWDVNIPVDILSSEKLGDISKYKAVVLPALLHIPEEIKKIICAYVKNGGKLIMDSGCDSRTDCGWAKPSHPDGDLSKILGGLEITKELYRFQPPLSKDEQYGVLPQGKYMSVMEKSEGPWGARQTKTAVFFATNPGEARFLFPDADFSSFYVWLKKWSGLEHKYDGLRVRKGKSGHSEIIFAHNMTEYEKAIPVSGVNILNGATTIKPDDWAIVIR